jgi:hypothetical protein
VTHRKTENKKQIADMRVRVWDGGGAKSNGGGKKASSSVNHSIFFAYHGSKEFILLLNTNSIET